MTKKASAKSGKTAKTPEENSLENKERAWRVAQLAATLATRYTLDLGKPGGDPEKLIRNAIPKGESDSYYDWFYQGLLERADDLLTQAEQWDALDKYVYADELFGQERFYSYKQIADVLKGVKWPKMTSRKPVEDFINEILEKVKQQNKELESYLDSNHLSEEEGVNTLELRRQCKSEKEWLENVSRKSSRGSKYDAVAIFRRARGLGRDFSDQVKIERSRLS